MQIFIGKDLTINNSEVLRIKCNKKQKQWLAEYF